MAFVTGAFGFLGRAVASALDAAGWRVAAIGHPTPPFPGPKAQASLSGHIAGEAPDRVLAHAAELVGAPDLVFHAAGGSSVGASVVDPARDRERTVGTLAAMLAFLKTHAPRARLIYPSSAAVYGSGHSGPIAEIAPVSPISPYGLHKAEAEAMIERAGADFGLQAVIVRFFSIYGPGLRKQLLWELARCLADCRSDQDPRARAELGGEGDEQRDFLYLDDALALVGLAMRARTVGAPLVVNGGSGRGASIRHVAETFAAAMGAPGRVRFSGKVREGDPASLIADIARARALGFEPATPLETGLERVAAWFSSQT